jgi:hypothetical protein
MSPHDSETGGAMAIVLTKFLPPAIGAAIMVAVDIPKTKRELFTRLLVAFACSYLFGEAVFDFLDSTSWFSFLDHAKRAHNTAVDGIVGGLGYSAASGLAMWLQKFRAQPIEALQDAKKVIE